MKFYILIVCFFILASCNLGTKSKESSTPCYYKLNVPKATEFKVNNKRLYYMLLGNEPRDLQILISDNDLSKKGVISSDTKYFSKETTLITCLKENKSAYIQDVWADLFNNIQDEMKKKYLEDNQLLISQPNIKTFKVDSNRLEIKSTIYNNLGDTTITTIEWAYEKNKYLFNTLVTVVENENSVND